MISFKLNICHVTYYHESENEYENLRLVVLKIARKYLRLLRTRKIFWNSLNYFIFTFIDCEILYTALRNIEQSWHQTKLFVDCEILYTALRNIEQSWHQTKLSTEERNSLAQHFQR